MPNTIIDSIKIDGVTYDIQISSQEDITVNTANATTLKYYGTTFANTFASIDHVHTGAGELGYFSDADDDIDKQDCWYMKFKDSLQRPGTGWNPNTYMYPTFDTYQCTKYVTQEILISYVYFNTTYMLPYVDNEEVSLKTGFTLKVTRNSGTAGSGYINIITVTNSTRSIQLNSAVGNTYYGVLGFYFGTTASVSSFSCNNALDVGSGIFSEVPVIRGFIANYNYASSADAVSIINSDTPNSYSTNKYYYRYFLTTDTEIKLSF